MIKNLASYIDFGYHHPDATEKDIERVCTAVLEYQLNSAFINPYYVPLVKKLLNNQRKTGTVISFPLGQETHETKIASLTQMLEAGADEFDVVLNIALIKEHRWDAVLEEMKSLVSVVRNFENRIIKFIPETGFLTTDEIKKVAELMVTAGADFFKTCSGYGPRGATIEDVTTVRAAVGDKIKVKVAGGIKTYEQVAEFIEAGASRIGTSRAVEIMNGAKLQQ